MLIFHHVDENEIVIESDHEGVSCAVKKVPSQMATPASHKQVRQDQIRLFNLNEPASPFVYLVSIAVFLSWSLDLGRNLLSLRSLGHFTYVISFSRSTSLQPWR